MRKYLLPPDLNWYRANLHCHSNLSDGYWPPARLRDEYRKAGYSVLAISDHNVLVDHSDLNTPDFLALTSVEYDITDWDTRLPMAKPDANEWDYRYHDTFHLNLFSKVPNPADRPARDTIWGVQHNCFEGTEEEKARKKPFSREAVNEVIRKANEAGFLVQYNHPHWSLNTQEDWRALRGLWSLEILNYATELKTGAEYCPMVYDDLLNHVGAGLFCSMGDDNHNRDGTTLQSFGGSTFFGAKELSYGAIVRSMERGEFFCASGRENPPRILALYAESGVIHVDCTPASSVMIVCDGRRYDARHGDGIAHAEFPVGRDDGWFRIAVRDDRGNTAHTHAYPSADCR